MGSQRSSCSTSTSCHWSSLVTAYNENGHPLLLQLPTSRELFLFSQECALAPWPEQRSRNKAHCQRLNYTGGGTAFLDTIVSVFWLFHAEWVLTKTASAPPLCLFCWDQGPRSRLKIPPLWAEAQSIIGRSLQFDLVPHVAIWHEEGLQKRESVAASSTCCNTEPSPPPICGTTVVMTSAENAGKCRYGRRRGTDLCA